MAVMPAQPQGEPTAADSRALVSLQHEAESMSAKDYKALQTKWSSFKSYQGKKCSAQEKEAKTSLLEAGCEHRSQGGHFTTQLVVLFFLQDKLERLIP